MLTTFQEVDMSGLIKMRKEYKDIFQSSHGAKLGFQSPFFLASAYALKQIPALNAYIDNATNEVVFRDYINIGFAAATPKGLVTPVIKNMETKNLAEVESEFARFAGLAKQDKLSMDDITGNTFTITNGGTLIWVKRVAGTGSLCCSSQFWLAAVTRHDAYASGLCRKYTLSEAPANRFVPPMAVRKGIVSVAGQEVKVKNGFLDDLLEDSSPESAQVVIERSTCPVFTRKGEASFQTSFGEAPLPELMEPIRAPWPSEMTTMDSLSGPGCDRMSWSSMASGYEPDMPLKVISRDVPAQPPQLPQPVRRANPAPAPNPAALLPAPSVGSQRHLRGEPCTPCPFFWKPSGCVEGRSCNFCHLCPDPTIQPAKLGSKKRAVQSTPPQAAIEGEPQMACLPMAEASGVDLVDGYAQYVGAGQSTGASTTSEQHQKVLEMQQKLCPSIFEDHAAGC
ncbi:DLST, partial [Symbiodinium sp. CCMP2456]